MPGVKFQKTHFIKSTALPGEQMTLSHLELHPLQKIDHRMHHKRLGRICS
jgi:hypothetical protein